MKLAVSDLCGAVTKAILYSADNRTGQLMDQKVTPCLHELQNSMNRSISASQLTIVALF